jgi:hypothetical protein
MNDLCTREQWLHNDETLVDSVYLTVCICASNVIVNHQREREREREAERKCSDGEQTGKRAWILFLT